MLRVTKIKRHNYIVLDKDMMFGTLVSYITKHKLNSNIMSFLPDIKFVH